MPTLALCMIVKNEEEMLAGCLESVKGIVDEMIVVDTGSTDNTKQIAIDAGAKVFDFEWINDFSAARNFAKSKTACDFVLSLDADERLYPADKDVLLDALDDFPHNVGYLELTNATSVTATLEEVLSGEKASGYGIFVPRLLKNIPNNDWMGRVHEIPEHHVTAKYIRANIIHLGGDPAFRAEHQKGERNLQLLEQVLLEEPNQPPMFYTYLAGEREAVGDGEGFFEALKMGWDTTLEFLKTKPEGVWANTGIAALYPATLFARNRFPEGFQAFGVLLENLMDFSTNPCNTLYQMLQTSLQISLPSQNKQAFYEAVLEGSKLLLTFADHVYPEPTIEGSADYKALHMQVLSLMKLQRFEEAQAALDLSRQYPSAQLDADLMQIELWIEQGDIEQCLGIFSQVLENHLTDNPDIWILGALILIVLGQQEDANNYLQQAIDMPQRRYASRHRINLLKGLFTRRCLLEGKPIAGAGVYGVLGAILSRQPVEVTHAVPSTLIEQVVERYVELGQIELLLRFFDQRAKHILPGVDLLVQKKLVEMGFEVVDDGQQEPAIIVGTHLDDVLGAFQGASNIQIVEFSAEERSRLETLIDAFQNQSIDDMLMGAMSFLEEDTASDEVEAFFQEKISAMKVKPLIVWDESWPLELLAEAFPTKQVLFYLGSPEDLQHREEDIFTWNQRNVQIVQSTQAQLHMSNIHQLQTAPQSVLDEMCAYIGVITPEGAVDKIVLPTTELPDWYSIFPTTAAQEVLKQWNFIS